jgi:hypothetical protein
LFYGFLDFFGFSVFIFFLFGFLDFFKYFFLDFIWIFFWFFGIPFKVTKVTTKSYQGYYLTPKSAKVGPKQHNRLFFARKAKKASTEAQSPSQELEIGTRSGPSLLVSFNSLNTFLAHAFKQCLERQTGRPIANVTDQCQLSTRLALTKTDLAPLRFNSSLE